MQLHFKYKMINFINNYSILEYKFKQNYIFTKISIYKNLQYLYFILSFIILYYFSYFTISYFQLKYRSNIFLDLQWIMFF